MKPTLRIKYRFNRTTPIIKQIFCNHDYEHLREDNGGWVRCYFLKCRKCGKFKDLNYYSMKRW